MRQSDPRGRAAHLIRILTVPPFTAAILILLNAFDPAIFPRPGMIAEALTFLTLVPVFAYPLCLMIPALKAGGRETQRKTAFICSGAGYALAAASGLILRRPKGLLFLYLTYLISLVLLSCVNRFTGRKASGHGCGVIWPVITGIRLCPAAGIPAGLLLYGITLWASVRSRRHTAGEFLLGTLICLVSAGISALILICLKQA